MVRRSGVSEELCSKCSAPLLPDALFCHACGTRRNAGRCGCGAILPPDASFCPACGATTRPTRPPPATRSPQLELRPVTVLYVDVIGSTRLAERLGPEAFREVLGQFIQSVWQLDAVCELFAEIAAGSLEEQHSTTADLLGRPAVALETFSRQFAGAVAPAS